MSVRHERLAPLDEEIARHDWRSVGSFIGDGSLLPRAVRRLGRAGSRDDVAGVLGD
jgi:hypothetical protein